MCYKRSVLQCRSCYAAVNLAFKLFLLCKTCMHVHSSALKKGKIRDLRTVPMFAFYLLKSVIKSYNDFVAWAEFPTMLFGL